MVLAAVPFVESWEPSERARALGAPVVVDISKLEIGQMIIATWRKQVIYIVAPPARRWSTSCRRTTSKLKDPNSKDSIQPAYAKNEMRSRRADVLVLIGICTHLGCLPKQFFDPGDPVLGRQLAGRIPLSLPWFALRSGRPRVRRLAGADQPERAAVQLQGPAHAGGRAG